MRSPSRRCEPRLRQPEAQRRRRPEGVCESKAHTPALRRRSATLQRRRVPHRTDEAPAPASPKAGGEAGRYCRRSRIRLRTGAPGRRRHCRRDRRVKQRNDRYQTSATIRRKARVQARAAEGRRGGGRTVHRPVRRRARRQDRAQARAEAGAAAGAEAPAEAGGKIKVLASIKTGATSPGASAPRHNPTLQDRPLRRNHGRHPRRPL